MYSLSMAAAVQHYLAMVPSSGQRAVANCASAAEILPASPGAQHDAGSGLRLHDDGLAGQDLVQAITRMLRDGSATFSLPAPDAQPETHADGASHADMAWRMAPRPASGALLADHLIDGEQIKYTVLGELQREGGTVALVVKLVQTPPTTVTRLSDGAGAGLPKWRLKRASAFIEENLENPITLAALAQAVGLSPVYFGAQFRLATGLSPHDYILRQRIRRAQELLLDPRISLLEVALSVGFQTQAHFSTVFKRIAGETPSHWRRCRLSGAGEPEQSLRRVASR